MLLPVDSVLGHHALYEGLVGFPITTIVISVGRIFADNDELLPATFRLLNLVVPQFLEDVHDMGHCLRVG